MDRKITSNPFSSSTFRSLWLNHFGLGSQPVTLDFIDGISFVKHRILPYYFNVGRNLTKGMVYNLKGFKGRIPKGETFLIYDVPNRFSKKPVSVNKGIGLYKSSQYLGYLCSLQQYGSSDKYMEQILSSKSRSKFRGYIRKLEKDYSINYKFYGSETNQTRLEYLFDELHNLLVKRFDHKKKSNKNLMDDEWAFQREISIALIKENRGGLLAVEADKRPIAMVLVYFYEDIVIDVMRVFDIDFSRYRPGSICTWKEIEWCFNEGYSYLDFSKGHFEYKNRWSNNRYPFEYHIYYDRKSLKSASMAFILFSYYQIKTTLRELGFDVLCQKAKYRLGF